jgi:hypothetical protein
VDHATPGAPGGGEQGPGRVGGGVRSTHG